MKKTNLFILTAALVFAAAMAPSNAHAGTWMVGGKAWIAVWDSFLPDIFDDMEDYDEHFDDTYIFSIDRADPGTGFLIGPMIGYQSADGLWSFSAAFMFISSFSQDIKVDVSYINFGDPSENYEDKETISADLKRTDLDFAFGWNIGHHFKLFAGYKYQDYDMAIKDDWGTIKYSMTAHMPTVGAGAAFPLSDAVVLGIQGGISYLMGDVKVEGESIDLENTLVYNGEINLSFLTEGNMILQAGYRFQQFKFEAETEMDGETFEYSATDRFHGLTLAAVFIM